MGQPASSAAWVAGASVVVLFLLSAAAGGVSVAAEGDQAPREAAVLEGGYRLCADGFSPCTCGVYRRPHSGAHRGHEMHAEPYAEQPSYTHHHGSGRRFCCCPAVTCAGQPSDVAFVTWACPSTAVGATCVQQCVNGTLGSVTAACGSGGAWDNPEGSCRLPRVLAVHASVPRDAEAVQATLTATGAFSEVVLFNGKDGTPTLAYLDEFDAVLAYSEYLWANATALGDVLADYWDAGGGVVVAPFANTNSAPGSDIQGRWASGGYQLISPAASAKPQETEPLILNEPTSPLVKGVTNLTAQLAYQSTGGLINGAVLVASWGSSQTPLIVRGVKAGRNLVELNMFPLKFPEDPVGWVGDGANIMRNALLFSITDAAP